MIQTCGATHLIRPAPARRLFTPQRAARALVLVRRIVADLARAHRRAEELHESLDAAETAGRGTQAADARDELLRAMDTVRRCREELDELGAEIEDAAAGIVDFPSRAGGREIRLCWQWGEHGVAWWHEADETCAQRRAIADL